MSDKEYIKTCSNCGGLQSDTTKSRLKCSIRENWKCNNGSSTHMKKIYSDEVVSEVVKLYKNGVNYSEVSMMTNIGRKNVKTILIEKNVWIEDRDKIKKEFSVDDIETIVKKYTEGLSAKKISIDFNVSITPIKRILKEKNILRDGKSDGVKINLSEEQISLIKKLYLDDYKNSEEIGCQLGLTKSFISQYLQLTDYRRNKSEGNSVGLVKRYRNISYDEYLNIEDDYKKYKNDVMRFTRQQSINQLPNYKKRNNSGVDGAFQLDHKYSISEGFNNNILPEIIGGIKNLEFIPWKENIKKRTKCSITINELVNN
jgi:transposase